MAPNFDGNVLRVRTPPKRPGQAQRAMPSDTGRTAPAWAARLPRIGVLKALNVTASGNSIRTARRRTGGKRMRSGSFKPSAAPPVDLAPARCPGRSICALRGALQTFRRGDKPIHPFQRKRRVGRRFPEAAFLAHPKDRSLLSGIKASAGVRKFDHASLQGEKRLKKYPSVELSLIAKNWSLSLPATYHCGLAQKNEFNADHCIWRRRPRFELWIFCSSRTLNVPAHSGGWRDGWISTGSTCWQVRETAS